MPKNIGVDLTKPSDFKDRSAEIEKERQEAERRRREQAIAKERSKMQEDLKTANETKDKLVKLASDVAEAAAELAVKISEVADKLVSATNNSSVGTSQFCSAASAAYALANNIQAQLSNAASNAGLVASVQNMGRQVANFMYSSVGSGGGGGGMTATMIHVAPEIAGARSEVASAAEGISKACASLTMLMNLIKMQAVDLQTAAVKMEGYNTSLRKMRAQISTMAADIDSTYRQYHAAQKDAIYRAALIPH